MIPTISPPALAKAMWGSYSAHAGGKTFDGKPLPTWDELGEERQGCWIAAAIRATFELGVSHFIVERDDGTP